MKILTLAIKYYGQLGCTVRGRGTALAAQLGPLDSFLNMQSLLLHHKLVRVSTPPGSTRYSDLALSVTGPTAANVWNLKILLVLCED